MFRREDWPVALDYYGEKGGQGIAAWLRPAYSRLVAMLRRSIYPAEPDEDPYELAQIRHANEQWAKTVQMMSKNLASNSTQNAQDHLEFFQQLYNSPHDPRLDPHLTYLIQIWQQILGRVEF